MLAYQHVDTPAVHQKLTYYTLLEKGIVGQSTQKINQGMSVGPERKDPPPQPAAYLPMCEQPTSKKLHLS